MFLAVHGTARFAKRDELEQSGLLNAWTNGAATDGLLLGWWWESEYEFAPISYAGDLHQLIVAGIGGGKFTTAIAPMLLGSNLDDSTVVVVDPKGEVATTVGRLLQKPFAERASVVLIDPWNICGTGNSAAVNVLDPIRPDNPNYVDDARALADAMIIPSGAENTHWDNAARNFLTGVILYVALHPKEEGQRDLPRVRDIITLSWQLPKAYTGPTRETLSALLYMNITSDLAGGVMARYFRALLNREDKERSGIISSIERDTGWMDSAPMAAVLKGPGIDLRNGVIAGGKYFIVIPPQYLRTHRAWLRLMVTSFANAMKQHRPAQDIPRHRRWRHIVIDEFATLGEMSFILDDVALGRGFDIKYHLVVQDLGQLKREYKDGWESFINNSFQRFFAVGDMFTANYVSQMLGASTVESETVGTSESDTVTRSEGLSHSTSEGVSTPFGFFPSSTTTSGTSDSTSSGQSESRARSASRSITPVQRPLLTADEVRRLGERDQLLFMQPMHPIRSWRPPYWEAFPSLPDYSLQEVLGTVGRAPVDEAERARFEGWRAGPLVMQPGAPKALTVVAPAAPPTPIERSARPPFPYRLPRVGWMLGGAAQLLWSRWLGVAILILIFAPMGVGPALGITEHSAFWVVLAGLVLALALLLAFKEAVRARAREVIAAAAAWGLVVLAAADLVPAPWAMTTYVLAGLLFASGVGARVISECQGSRALIERSGRMTRWLASALFIGGALAFTVNVLLERGAGEWHALPLLAMIGGASFAGLATASLGAWLAVSGWYLAAPSAAVSAQPGASKTAAPH